jgi:hypothetical protein
MSNDHQFHDPWHLISARQYEEAVAAYDAILAAGEIITRLSLTDQSHSSASAVCLKRWRVLPRQMTSLVRTRVHPSRHPT